MSTSLLCNMRFLPQNNCHQHHHQQQQQQQDNHHCQQRLLRRRLHRFYLPEMLQCFASAPSSAVWEPSSDPPSSFGTSQIDAMLRFASAPSFVRPSQADAVLRFSAIFASAFPSWCYVPLQRRLWIRLPELGLPELMLCFVSAARSGGLLRHRL